MSNCPECDARVYGSSCKACGWNAGPHERAPETCDACNRPYTQQIAGRRVCLTHYLEIQERNPRYKPEVVLAAEDYFHAHPEFHRQDGETLGEYMRRTAKHRTGPRRVAAAGQETGGVVGVTFGCAGVSQGHDGNLREGGG